MFKGIDIKLSGPICDCDERNLAWGIHQDSTGPGLYIECNTCKTKLQVPNKRFKAGFIFDTPYPGKKEIKPKPELKALDGGKILDFNKEKNPE